MIREVRAMKVLMRHKKAVIIIMVILFFIGYALNWFAGEFTWIGNVAVAHYNKRNYDVTPFSERGNSQKEFNFFHQENMGVFTAVSSVLIATYTEDDFQEQKEFLENREQRQKRIGENWSNEPFSIHSWTFIVDGESRVPKNLTIFGFNEKKHKIAYIKFTDNDLDDIYETPQEFFRTYIKYVFI